MNRSFTLPIPRTTAFLLYPQDTRSRAEDDELWVGGGGEEGEGGLVEEHGA